jgi:carbonic anhydrase
MKKYLRIALEVLLVILLVASSTVAYMNFSGKKHLSIDMEEVAAELDETKDTLDKTKEQLEEAQKKSEELEEAVKQFETVKQAFANGVLLQDVEALYKAQKVLNAERLVGLGTVRQLSKGFEDASAVEAFQKSLDIAELGARMQAVCAAQNSLVSAGKKVKVLAECTGKLEKPAEHAKSAHNVHWGYEGDHGPEHWGDNFATCAAGKKQSPLNIVGPFEKAKDVVKAEYKEGPMKIINNGHTIQVNIEAGSGTLTVNKEQYELLQFHFHRPSEEQIDGKTLAMTVHFVHKSKEGKLAVLGVLLNEGKENATIKSLWANLPPKEGEEYVPAKMLINPSSLLPSDMSFYSYEGSLTTPPCTEGVNFFILKNNVDISKSQVAKFPFKLNARPVQATNDRKIYAN